MTRLIEVPFEDGSSIVVEVDEPEQAGGVVKVARPGEIAGKASQTFEAALDKLKPVAAAVITKLRSLRDSPDEIELEFGLKLSAEAGIFVASVGGEAHYKLTLKWKRGVGDDHAT